MLVVPHKVNKTKKADLMASFFFIGGGGSTSVLLPDCHGSYHYCRSTGDSSYVGSVGKLHA
jgi:hypothetical protein